MLITRLFHSVDDANAAIADLKEAGFGKLDLRVVSQSGEPVTRERLEREGVLKKNSEAYAERLNQGGALVLMHPPLGSGGLATSILQKRRPLDGEETEGSVAPQIGYEQPDVDPATPLSSFYNLPVLLSDPTPLSTYMNWRVLSEDQGAKSGVLRNPAPLSSTLGLKLLSNKAAPLSAATGAPVLSDDPAPLSRRFNWRVLWDRAAPLSDRLGWKTVSPNSRPSASLSNNPAPFSALLHIKVLSSD